MALPNYYNEMYSEDGSVRPQYAAFAEWLRETPATRIAQNRQAADLLFHRVGITFAVYGEASGTERLIPFDIVPHVISGADWDRLARGLRQRVEALNRFLHDIYHTQEIISAGHAKDAVDKTILLVEKNEYKRRQAPVGLRVTSKAFGTGRRFPIARKY